MAQAVKLDASMRVVILRGPDRFLTRAYTDRLLQSLRAEHGEIEEFRFDGNTVSAAAVLDELRSYGLLQSYKLVIVDEAEKFLAAKEPAAGAGAGAGGRHRTARELMEKYAAEPMDCATLLLRAETWRPGRLDKAVAKVGTVIKCDAPNASAATTWCTGRCRKEHRCDIEPAAAAMLVELTGPDLARLDAELGKLAAAASGGGEGVDGMITTDHVGEMVGRSRSEQAWSIQSALLSGSPRLTVTKLRELLTVSGQPEQLIMWSITDLIRKLHAAAQRIAEGVPSATIARELRLFGEGREPVLRAARRLDVDRFAQLLRRSIEADRGTKSGLGKGARTLEALAIEIADTLGS